MTAAATLDSTAAMSEVAAALRGVVAVVEVPLDACSRAVTPLRAAELVGSEGAAEVEEVSCASAPAAPFTWAVVRALEDCREAVTEVTSCCCKAATELAAAWEEVTASAPEAEER